MQSRIQKSSPNMNICKLLSNNRKLVGITLLSLVLLTFQLIYQFKYVAIQEGWAFTWTALMRQGAVPYKDFFTVASPLNIIFSYWLDIIGGGQLIVPQIFGVLSFVATWIVLFLLLCECFEPKYSFMATISGAFFFAHAQYLTAFGWLQMAQLFFVIFLYLFVKLHQQIKILGNSLALSYFSGFVMSLILLSKQSSGLLVSVAFVVVFIVMMIKEKPKKAWTLSMLFAIGVLTPFVLIGLWLCLNGAFMPCIEQVFGGASAKGNPIAILFAFIPRITTASTVIIFCSFCGLMLLLRYLYKKQSLSDYPRLFIQLVATVLGVIFCLAASDLYFPYFRNFFGYLGSEGKNIYIVIIVLIIMICLLANYLFINRCGQLSKVIHRYEDIYTFVVTSSLFLLTFLITCCLDANMRTGINGSLNTRGMTDTWSWYAFYFVVIVSITNLFSILFLKKSLCNFKFWILCVGCSAWLWSCGMSHTVVPAHAPVAMATIICTLFAVKIKYNRIKNVVIIVLCITVSAGTLLDRMGQPYSWWGWTEPPIVESALVPIKVEKMRGFRASPRTANAIETICSLIEENSPADADLLAFPHIALFNVLTDRYPKNTFSAVYQIDTCPDDVALDDADTLRNNPPDMIVYCIMDETYPGEFSAYWDVHEYLFRGGNRCGQRDIRELIEDWVEKGEFNEIGRVENLVVFKRS